MSNASTSSLIEPPMSSAASLYSNANGSTSTLVPGDRAVEKEKEKHKHNFLSRQKNKLWDKDEFHLPLSSASSTSKPTDPNAHPLYSFTPSSPANSSAFAKTVSGLDLRHGARALREKKKEERAGSSLSTTTYMENAGRERENSFGNSEWPITNFSSSAVSISNASQNLSTDFGFSPAEVANLGATFGVPGITPDDAWPLLRTRLHNVFEGEDPRPPIEDFNSLVSVHLRRCIQRRSPATMIEDLSDLLRTGFTSLSATLKSVPDERLVPHLVAMWSLVFHTVLPFLQAVFLPLDLEFKGRGPVMSAREAADFWGVALPEDGDVVGAVGGGGAPDGVPLLLAEDLDVRRMVLLTFRDTIFLPRYDALMAIFSRLSLESIDAGVPSSPLPPLDPPPPLNGGGGGVGSGEGGGGGGGSGTASPRRPGTASSNDAALSSLTSPAASFSSISASTLMGGGGPQGPANGAATTAAGRSRATSSTSAGSWTSAPTTYGGSGGSGSNVGPAAAAPAAGGAPRRAGEGGVGGLLYAQQVLDTGARVTDMVGRMLQCVSVLASVHSGDEAQGRMESLTKTLKWNWLGRGRTGRQRRGFVGTKVGAKFRGEVEVGS
jgi:hypothetical protein